MKIRAYAPSDIEDIHEISSHIWEGNDYLPQLIDEYLESEHCHPVVIEVDGKVVCVANTHQFSSKWVWLEAMRTHPQFRGRGYATQLTRYQEQMAEGLKARATWLFTSTQNQATRKMLQRLNYQEVSLYKWWGFRMDNDTNGKDTDEQGRLIDITRFEYHLSEETKQLAHNWRLPYGLEEIAKMLENISATSDIPPLLVGEFKCFPIDSYFVTDMLDRGKILVLKKPLSIMTIQESREFANSLMVGVISTEAKGVEAAMYQAYLELRQSGRVKDTRLELFYPNQVNSRLFDTDWVFRLMTKKI